MAKKRVKKRTHIKKVETPNDPKTPKSFVIRTGKTMSDPTSSVLAQLVLDVRKIMEPNTATRLRERHGNKLKDYLTMAGPLGVTHLLLFSRTETGATLRIARTPRGPTLHFKIHSYSLSKDVKNHQKAPKESVNDFLNPPLLVLNGFSAPKDVKPPPELTLLTSTFQHLFPPLSAQTTPVSSIRRVLLCNRTQIPSTSASGDKSSTDIIDLRHFSISTKAVGLPRTVRKTAAKSSVLPNLGKLEDVAEFVLNGHDYDSASEVEDDDKVEVRSPSVKQEATSGTQQRAIRLTEIGPRLRLELVKIEDGMCDGKVLYHRYVHKTKREEKELETKHRTKSEEKARRRKEQEENVARRKAEKEAQSQSQKRMQKEDEDEEMDVDEDDEDDEDDEVDQQELLLALENEMEG